MESNGCLLAPQVINGRIVCARWDLGSPAVAVRLEIFRTNSAILSPEPCFIKSAAN